MKKVLCIDDKRRQEDDPKKPMPVIGKEYLVTSVQSDALNHNLTSASGLTYYIPALCTEIDGWRIVYDADRFIDADEPVEEITEAEPQLETA